MSRFKTTTLIKCYSNEKWHQLNWCGVSQPWYQWNFNSHPTKIHQQNSVVSNSNKRVLMRFIIELHHNCSFNGYLVR